MQSEDLELTNENTERPFESLNLTVQHGDVMGFLVSGEFPPNFRIFINAAGSSQRYTYVIIKKLLHIFVSGILNVHT